MSPQRAKNLAASTVDRELAADIEASLQALYASIDAAETAGLVVEIEHAHEPNRFRVSVTRQYGEDIER